MEYDLLLATIMNDYNEEVCKKKTKLSPINKNKKVLKIRQV